MICAGLVISGDRGCNVRQSHFPRLSTDYERCYGVLWSWWGCQVFVKYNKVHFVVNVP